MNAATVEHLGVTPGLAQFTCNDCPERGVVGIRYVCWKFSDVLNINASRQFIRLPACIAESRGNLND